jgi:transposase
MLFGDVGKTYRPWAPLQGFLLPPSPTEWLPDGHLAYFVLDVVDELDLGVIERAVAAKDPRGERPYSPRMLTALLLYGYCVGVFSSRRIARATFEDVAFRVLAGGTHPHFTTINEFRLKHGVALGGLFVQGLRLCARAGLVELDHVAVDGTKILANASKHKAMSYKRMKDEEARLTAQVQSLLEQADEADREEDQTYGVGQDPWCDVPEELRRRETRLARIRAMKAELEQEAARARAQELRKQAVEQHARASDPDLDVAERKRSSTRAKKNEAKARDLDGDDDSQGGETGDLPSHRVPHGRDGTPTPDAQRNFTDPDSRIMVRGGSWVQAYNAQIAVDEAAQVIVAQAVTNQPPDPEHLVPLRRKVRGSLGDGPRRATADSGYYTGANVEYCEANGIDAFISVGRTTHHGETGFVATAGAGPTRERMVEKLTTRLGRAIYRRRKVIAEPPFGQIQAARGFRRFSLRGIGKVRFEWALVCLTHNLLKLFRATWAPAAPPTG